MFKHDKVESALAIAGLVILSLTALASVAGTKTTVKPGDFQLLDEQGAAISNHATVDECVAAAGATVGEYRCITMTEVSVVGVCDMPAPKVAPPQTDAWAVQIGEVEWVTEVPGWVPASYDMGCWVVGRVELKYDSRADNGTRQYDNEPPGPWTEGLDFPYGDPCPAESVAGCVLLVPGP